MLKSPIFEAMNKINLRTVFIALTVVLLSSCKNEKKPEVAPPLRADLGVENAVGFTIDNTGAFPVIKVTNPWPNAEKEFVYAFIPKDKLAQITYPKDAYDAVVTTPIENIIVTSTTHVPALEVLGGLEKLSGFPDTKYISSMPARQMIANGRIKELGNNENLNTEMVLEIQPDAIIGFAINNQNTNYELLQKSGIPVLFNGDWMEQTPLGKAEWLKFFGVLLNKQKMADSVFQTIKTSYTKVKALAQKATHRPTVLSGSLYKDVWYLPAGESWAAQFLKDANAQYLWSETKGTGSLSLSLETTLEKGKNADFWISPGQFTTYSELTSANDHYAQFSAFSNRSIHTFAATKGPADGLLYYELGPQRPDLILKDLVHIFHPELLPEYVPYFFQPLR